jgi:hypothetical protein
MQHLIIYVFKSAEGQLVKPKIQVEYYYERHKLNRTKGMTLSLGLLLISILALSCLVATIFKEQDSALAQSFIQTIKYRNLVIDLGNGVKTNAQLTLPAIGKGPFPGVLLIPDMNYGGIFWQIAQYLSERGFVVLRYDKRSTVLSLLCQELVLSITHLLA